MEFIIFLILEVITIAMAWRISPLSALVVFIFSVVFATMGNFGFFLLVITAVLVGIGLMDENKR